MSPVYWICFAPELVIAAANSSILATRLCPEVHNSTRIMGLRRNPPVLFSGHSPTGRNRTTKKVPLKLSNRASPGRYCSQQYQKLLRALEAGTDALPLSCVWVKHSSLLFGWKSWLCQGWESEVYLGASKTHPLSGAQKSDIGLWSVWRMCVCDNVTLLSWWDQMQEKLPVLCSKVIFPGGGGEVPTQLLTKGAREPRYTCVGNSVLKQTRVC